MKILFSWRGGVYGCVVFFFNIKRMQNLVLPWFDTPFGAAFCINAVSKLAEFNIFVICYMYWYIDYIVTCMSNLFVFVNLRHDIWIGAITIFFLNRCPLQIGPNACGIRNINCAKFEIFRYNVCLRRSRNFYSVVLVCYCIDS